MKEATGMFCEDWDHVCKYLEMYQASSGTKCLKKKKGYYYLDETYLYKNVHYSFIHSLATLPKGYRTLRLTWTMLGAEDTKMTTKSRISWVREERSIDNNRAVSIIPKVVQGAWEYRSNELPHCRYGFF